LKNWNFYICGTNPADRQACSQCPDPAMIVFSTVLLTYSFQYKYKINVQNCCLFFLFR